MSYEAFDSTYKFSDKAGFQLTPKQVALVVEASKWSRHLNKLEVGCGKTVISTVVSLMTDYNCTIVIMPPILLRGWNIWLNQVSSGVVRYSGTPSERRELQAGIPHARWVLCSYDIFRRDFDTIMSLVSKVKRLELIVDEGHALKNSKSILFKKVNKALAGNRGIQILTGTPISKPLDAYSYIKLKTPRLYKNNTAFEALHVAERDFFKKPTKYANLDLLSERLNLQSISGTKKDIHGYSLQALMPDCSYELDPAHYKLYERLVDDNLLEFDDGSIIDASTSQRLRQALQQLVINWGYFANDESMRPAFFDMLDLTIEEIEVTSKNNSKLLIWTKYKRSSKRIWDYCLNLGIKTVAAYGDTNSEKAAQMFMEDDDTRILVAQPQSAGAGLNPQHVCSESLFAEIDTVSHYARQALGRIDRVGQTRVPRQKIAVAARTVQEGLLRDLLDNDDLVQRIEPTKKAIRAMLLGG